MIGKTGRDISTSEADQYIGGYGELSNSFKEESPELGSEPTLLFVLFFFPSFLPPYEALAIDMTARNLQDAVKKKGLPWSAAKGFDTFNPISHFIEKSSISDPANVRLFLKTNNQIRQDGNTKDMIFDIPQLIQHVSSIMTIEVGDLLLTGE